jgi:hypothetical protein
MISRVQVKFVKYSFKNQLKYVVLALNLMVVQPKIDPFIFPLSKMVVLLIKLVYVLKMKLSP